MVLFGAGGHCKPILDILFLRGIHVDAIYDQSPKVDQIFGVKVCTLEKELSRATPAFLSIGSNEVRKRLSMELSLLSFETLIHPSSVVSSMASIGEGTVVMAGVVVNPDATIGTHCILNTSCVIEHDCVVENFAHISPGASLAGGVQVGEGAHVGIGASIIQGVKIGKWSRVGAGAVIIKDVPDFATVVGNPGRIL